MRNGLERTARAGAWLALVLSAAAQPAGATGAFHPPVEAAAEICRKAALALHRPSRQLAGNLPLALVAVIVDERRDRLAAPIKRCSGTPSALAARSHSAISRPEIANIVMP